jgi:hypothetical protein
MANEIDLGKVSITPVEQPWTDTATVEINDIWTYQDATYLALQNSVGVTPTDDKVYWSKLIDWQAITARKLPSFIIVISSRSSENNRLFWVVFTTVFCGFSSFAAGGGGACPPAITPDGAAGGGIGADCWFGCTLAHSFLKI